MRALVDFSSHPLWLNLGAFVAAAAIVWWAGTRITRYADAIAKRTGMGHAFLGMVLLGGITSLPELATTVTASLTGNAALAVNNVLGGVALQVVILAIADVAVGRDALSSVIAKPTVLLQGTFCVLLLVVAAIAVAVGEAPLFGAGAGTWAVAALFALAVWLLGRYERDEEWRPVELPERRGARRTDERRDRSDGGRRLLLLTVSSGVAITAGGFVLAQSGDAIATQTGIGASFVGAVLVGGATSLPEVSTVLAAVRIRRYEMAVSDIFGTNLFDVMLLFVADLVYTGRPILGVVGPFALVAALLGIALTTVYLAGLIERKNRAVARMGLDSAGVILAYGAGLLLLYRLR